MTSSASSAKLKRGAQKAGIWGSLLIGALATFGGVSVGSWKLVIQPDLKRMAPAKVVERTEALEEAVTGCVDEDPDCTDEQKAKGLQAKVQRLGERSVSQEVLTVEGIRFLGNKIDGVEQKEPESLEAASKRVDKILRKRAVEEIFSAEPNEEEEFLP